MKIQNPNKSLRRGFTSIQLIFVLTLIGMAILAVVARKEQKVHAVSETQRNLGPFTVKGFYIGMHTNELRRVIDTNFSDWSFDRSHAILMPNCFMLSKEPADFSRSHVVFEFNREGEVVSIHFTALATDAIFKSANQSGSEFVNYFKIAYDIDEMEGMKEGWYWTGKGVKIRISEEKEIAMEPFSAESVLENFK